MHKSAIINYKNIIIMVKNDGALHELCNCAKKLKNI